MTIDLYDQANPTVLIGTGTTDANGNFQVQIFPGVYKSDGTTDGPHTILIQAVDQSGTKGNIVTFTFVLDTIPPISPTSITLDPSSVVSPGLSITKHNNVPSPGNAPLFDVTGIEPGATVELFRNSVLVNTTTNVTPTGANNLVTIADINNPTNAQITDGTYTYSATQIDLAGNPAPLPMPTTSVTILTVTPAAPLTIQLDPTSDTGTFNNDSITRDNNSVANPTNAPLFDITGIQSGATVNLYRNGVIVGTIANAAPTGPNNEVMVYDDNNGTPGQFPIADGTYTYKAQQVDIAGNMSLLSAGTTVIITHTPPLAPSAPVLEAASDTGRLNNDDITSRNNNPPGAAPGGPRAGLRRLQRPAHGDRRAAPQRRRGQHADRHGGRDRGHRRHQQTVERDDRRRRLHLHGDPDRRRRQHERVEHWHPGHDRHDPANDPDGHSRPEQRHGEPRHRPSRRPTGSPRSRSSPCPSSTSRAPRVERPSTCTGPPRAGRGSWSTRGSPRPRAARSPSPTRARARTGPTPTRSSRSTWRAIRARLATRSRSSTSRRRRRSSRRRSSTPT